MANKQCVDTIASTSVCIDNRSYSNIVTLHNLLAPQGRRRQRIALG